MRSNPTMKITKFAIYVRISRDRTGAGLGVERQEEDCRELAARLGGEVSAVFADNDISAYSGKRRPGYTALIESMKSGQIDAVVAWHTDRLHRSMVELEAYVTASETHGVSTHTVKAGPIDLATPSGRLVARQLGAVARYEVEHMVERQRAAKLHAAKSGLPSGGTRPYGYEQNGMVIIEEEAAVAREIIDRFIRGDSWRSIAFDLNDRGLRTAKGHMWAAINVRNVAVRPRNISIRTHIGNEYPAQWPPLISKDTWNELHLAIKRGQTIYGERSFTRKHLLQGFVFCGRCGTRMHIVSAHNRNGPYTPAFGCRTKDHRGQKLGCGRTKRRKEPLEDLVFDALMYRLDTPELGAMLSNNKDISTELKQTFEEHEAQSQRLREILDLYSTGEMTFDEYKISKATAQARLDQLKGLIDSKSSRITMANIPAGKTVREAWDAADINWRRQLVDALIDKVYVDPRIPGTKHSLYKEKWQFDPELIRIEWKA